MLVDGCPKDRRMDGWLVTEDSGWRKGWLHGRMDGMDGVDGMDGMDGCMDAWMHGCMDGLIHGYMDTWING